LITVLLLFNKNNNKQPLSNNKGNNARCYGVKTIHQYILGANIVQPNVSNREMYYTNLILIKSEQYDHV